MEQKLLLRVDEAAKLLSVSKVHLYGLIYKGVVPHVRLGGKSIRVPVRGLEQAIERLQKQAEAV